MGEVLFLVGGTSVLTVGREAERLHQSRVDVLECSEDQFPELAGRRLFMVKYSDNDITIQDVEIIRQALGRSLQYRTTSSLPSSQAWSVVTDTDGNNTFYPRRFGPDELPPSRGEGHEDDRPPRDRQSSRGSYADEYDGRDWEWDFPEPQPHRSRRRNTYANDDDRGDEYEDDPAPPPPRGRRRHSYANEFDLDDGYEDDLEPSSHGSRRRHSYMSGYDRGNRYWGSPERPRYGDPSRGTYARDYDHGSSYASSSNGRVRDWGDFEPARTCSYAFNRQGSNSYRDAPVPPWATNHPSWANHPSQRRRLGARPGSSTICGLVRSFLNYTMT